MHRDLHAAEKQHLLQKGTKLKDISQLKLIPVDHFIAFKTIHVKKKVE